jgi:hypothetical protein
LEVHVMRRVLAVAALIALIGAGASAPVSAASPPTITKFPSGTIDLGNINDFLPADACPFPVDVVIHVLGGARVIMFNGQGIAFAGISTGAIKADITNLDTGQTVTVNISGPGFVNGDGLPVLGHGPWAIYEPAAEGGIRFLHGSIRFEPVSYGVHAILIAGTEENLCDRLA